MRYFGHKTAIALLVLFPLAAGAGWRGFKSQQLLDNQYAVSYTPKTVLGKVPNLMLLLIGNTGALCLEEGYSFAKVGKIDVGNKYHGIKQISTTVELFKEETEGASSCQEMAKKPKTPTELQNYKEPDSQDSQGKEKSQGS